MVVNELWNVNAFGSESFSWLHINASFVTSKKHTTMNVSLSSTAHPKLRCLLAVPWVQLSVSASNGWPHNALRHHWLMPISCHFRDCKALLVTSLTHVSGAIASVQTFTFNKWTVWQPKKLEKLLDQRGWDWEWCYWQASKSITGLVILWPLTFSPRSWRFNAMPRVVTYPRLSVPHHLFQSNAPFWSLAPLVKAHTKLPIQVLAAYLYLAAGYKNEDHCEIWVRG